MSSTKASERPTRRAWMAAASAMLATLSRPAMSVTSQEPMTMATAKTLSPRQQAIAPITAAAAVGDMPRLNAALAQWLIPAHLAPRSYVVSQGTALGRAGRVHVDQEGAQTWIGGQAVTCMRGEVRL